MKIYIVQGIDGYVFGIYRHYEDAKQFIQDHDIYNEWKVRAEQIIEHYVRDEG